MISIAIGSINFQFYIEFKNFKWLFVQPQSYLTVIQAGYSVVVPVYTKPFKPFPQAFVAYDRDSVAIFSGAQIANLSISRSSTSQVVFHSLLLHTTVYNN